LGSGVLFPSDNLLLGGSEPSARESLAAGADLVCFSGDKLLGGPQAGIVVGRADLVEQLRRHPLQRAMRADKLTLAALEGTLRLHLDAPERIPVLRMLRDDAEAVRARASRLAELVGGAVEETVGRVGGGALPLAELPSFACAIDESLAAPLRGGEPPVVGIVRDADEGGRPETLEHLAILRLLGIERGVVALTKSDLVDLETLELARAEAEELVPGAPVVAVSARSGSGLDELRGALSDVATE